MSIEEGAPWAFIKADGERAEYTIQMCEMSEGPEAIVSLKNISNGGIAWATKKWLREGQKVAGRGYWIGSEVLADAEGKHA